MYEGVNTILSNLGVSFEMLIILVLLMTNIIPFAKGFKEGLVYGLVVYALVFIWFYEFGFNYSYPLILFFISLILLAFTLVPVQRAGQGGIVG